MSTPFKTVAVAEAADFMVCSKRKGGAPGVGRGMTSMGAMVVGAGTFPVGLYRDMVSEKIL